jgi:hypothetical protein
MHNDEPLTGSNFDLVPKDPDRGRGLAAHNRTQNYLASALRDPGWIPKSPKPSEPQYDLAWTAHEMLFVCEVKSLTPDNEDRQLQDR